MKLAEKKVRVEIPEQRSIYTEYARDQCRYEEYMYEETFEFEKGKIYGILGDGEEGGGGLTWLLSGKELLKNEIVTVFGKEYKSGETVEEGWHLSEDIQNMNKSAWRQLSNARKRSGSELSVQDIIEEFHLSEKKIHKKMKEDKWEVWKVSAAVGYLLGKEIFCFPWLPTLMIKEIIMYTGYFNYVEKLRREGCILLLPSSNREILEAITDEIVELNHPRFSDFGLYKEMADAYKKGNLSYQWAVDC